MLNPLQRIGAATAAVVALGVTATAIYQKVEPAPVVAFDSARVQLDPTHLATITATDSGTVRVAVTGGSWPLVAEAYPKQASAWAAGVDAAASATPADSVEPAPPGAVLELVHNSDVLRYQRLGVPAGSSAQTTRHELSIAIGPNNLPVYTADISRSTLDTLTAGVTRAAAAAAPHFSPPSSQP